MYVVIYYLPSRLESRSLRLAGSVRRDRVQLRPKPLPLLLQLGNDSVVPPAGAGLRVPGKTARDQTRLVEDRAIQGHYLREKIIMGGVGWGRVCTRVGYVRG